MHSIHFFNYIIKKKQLQAFCKKSRLRRDKSHKKIQNTAASSPPGLFSTLPKKRLLHILTAEGDKGLPFPSDF